MQTTTLRGALLPGLILAGCGLLAACGVNANGTGGGASSQSNANTYTGTPGTVQALPQHTLSPTTPTAAPVSTGTSGGVRLVLNKAAYAGGSMATVTIENGLGTKIAVTDHHTNCTYVQLEQLVGGTWQPVGLCKGLSPIRLVELAPGSVTTQRISIPAGSGTYRVMLQYNTGTVSAVFSSTFSVG